MKKFKFTLASYLKATEIKRDQQKKELSKIFEKLRSQNTLINSLEREIELVKDYETSSLLSGMSSLDLNHIRLYLTEINGELKEQNKKRAEILEKIEKLRSELANTMGEIKGLEKIKEFQYQEYLEKIKKESEIIIEEFLNCNTKNNKNKLQMT